MAGFLQETAEKAEIGYLEIGIWIQNGEKRSSGF
jgi:hypothetical protein